MTQPEICKCPECGTPHVVLWMDKSKPNTNLEAAIETCKILADVNQRLKEYTTLKPEYQIDPNHCIEPVSKDGWLTEQQCTRVRGHGKEGAFCKQHSVLHLA